MEPTSNATSNPLAQQFNIMVSIPQTVKIKLVDASLLNDFEIWMYLSTLLLNFCTAFWISYAQNEIEYQNTTLLFTSICFTVLFTITLIVAITKRVKMTKKSKEIQLTTTVTNPALP